MNDVFPKPSFLEIAETYVPALVGIKKRFREKLLGKTVDDKQAVRHLEELALLIVGKRLLYLNTITVGEPFQRIYIAILLMLHHEADGIPALAAPETLVDFLGRRYREGGGLLIMERTKTQEVSTPFLQLHELTNHVQDVQATEDLLYGIGGDHSGRQIYFFVAGDPSIPGGNGWPTDNFQAGLCKKIAGFCRKIVLTYRYHPTPREKRVNQIAHSLNLNPWFR